MKTMGIVFAGGILIAAMGAVSAYAQGAADIYAEKCAVCHGEKGEGAQTGPALKGDEFVLKATLDEVKGVILNGRGGADKLHPEIPIDMPAGLANEEEAGLLAKFVKEDLQK
jgi:cytochrome c6